MICPWNDQRGQWYEGRVSQILNAEKVMIKFPDETDPEEYPAHYFGYKCTSMAELLVDQVFFNLFTLTPKYAHSVNGSCLNEDPAAGECYCHYKLLLMKFFDTWNDSGMHQCDPGPRLRDEKKREKILEELVEIMKDTGNESRATKAVDRTRMYHPPANQIKKAKDARSKPESWPVGVEYTNTILPQNMWDILALSKLYEQKMPHLEIRQVPILQSRNLGVYATKPLRKGHVFGQYAGKLVKASSLRRCLDLQNDYIMDISDNYCIDASEYGNETRFMNDYRGFASHSNAEYSVKTEGVPYVTIDVVASRDIKAGEQILLDYGSEYWRSCKKRKPSEWPAIQAFHSELHTTNRIKVEEVKYNGAFKSEELSDDEDGNDYWYHA